MIATPDLIPAESEKETATRATRPDLSLYALVRKAWFRISLPVFSAALALYYSFLVPETNVLRDQVVAAFQPALFLAGFTSGVTLFSISTFVRHLRAAAYAAVANVRA
jgi:hypothetical protein